MKLTQEIKRMLSALAYANAGENLTRRQMNEVLSGRKTPVVKPEVVVPQAARSQVALYLGAELPAEVMQYVMQTCARLKHGLTVLTFQSETEAEALLAAYRKDLADAGIALRVDVLAGEAPAALARALKRRPEVAFLVCNESGFFGHGLVSGAQSKSGMPVPVVLVAANEHGAGEQVVGLASRSQVKRAA